MRNSIVLLAFCCCFYHITSAQNSCTPTFAKTFGSALATEGGNSLAMDVTNKVIYAAGYVNDSTLLVKMNADGDILWSRAFDVLRKQPERVAAIILDSDGMLVISGMTDLTIGGKVYLMKYNPDLDQILWVNEYKSHSNDYGYSMIEKSPGGNYLMSNNPFSPNDAELLEIDRSTGSVNPNFSKHYHMSSSQTMMDLTVFNGGLYATGRFTDGGTTSKMRTMLTQLNPDDGLPIWIKLGHRPNNVDARLYGSDLVVDQDNIYSSSHGDPDGIDVSDDQMYIQKTSLSGEMEWLKHYQVPGVADVSDEMIATGDGFVIMGRNRGPSNIFLLKINHAGDVLWAKTYDFAENDNTFFNGGAGTQLVMMDNTLYFTAYAEEDGRRDMILVKTDHEGRLDDSCFTFQSIEITVTPVTDAVFFPVEPTIFTFIPEVIALDVAPAHTSLQIENTCLAFSHPITELEESICMGDVFEGYDQAGTYIDTFPISNGCDSIRILHLRLLNCDPLVIYDLNACAANMVTGTNMDYAEFVPHYPEVSTCAAVSAGYLFRSPPQENKHSCTPGLNDSPAMCVSALGGCTYLPGNSASVVIEVTLTPEPASIFQFTAMKFYEKAPATYNWIDGDSGPNNYPTLFGIRILKNGTEIYSNPAVPTATTWNLKEFDFTDDTLFEIEVPTLFRIELLPYCPVGNGAAVSAWDLEDIVILGGCVRLPGDEPLITGKVVTSKNTPVEGAEIHYSKDHLFNVYASENVNTAGTFQLSSVQPGTTLYLKGHHNHNFLQGVSTLDLLAIQKHLLGINLFTSLDQYVAADINHDGRVTINDLITLRKTILGYTPFFPNNTSWRFGLWPQTLESTDPNSLKEIAFIESLQGGITNTDFLGIKIGDLNGNVFSDATSAKVLPRGQAFELAMQDVEMSAGKPFTVHIKATEAVEVEGLQLAWQLDEMSLAGIEGKGLNITDEHISYLEDGVLRLSWIAAQPISVHMGDVLFSLTFVAGKNTSLVHAIRQANEILSNEIYTPTETLPIELRLDPYSDSLTNGIGYFSIAPNPFNEAVNLKFLLFNDADVLIYIYDASGKEVFVHEAYYKAGEHLLAVTDDDLRHASGLFVCRMVSGDDIVVRKVVRVE